MMTTKPSLKALILLILVIYLGFAAGVANAQLAGGNFEIRRSTIDAGGGKSSGGVFELQGSIGQPDTGSASGGEFELFGGFWTPDASDFLFKDSYEG